MELKCSLKTGATFRNAWHNMWPDEFLATATSMMKKNFKVHVYHEKAAI